MKRPDPYYYHRAETELKLARYATHEAAIKAHYTLAGHYLDRYYGAEAASAVPRHEGGSS